MLLRDHRPHTHTHTRTQAEELPEDDTPSGGACHPSGPTPPHTAPSDTHPSAAAVVEQEVGVEGAADGRGPSTAEGDAGEVEEEEGVAAAEVEEGGASDGGGGRGGPPPRNCEASNSRPVSRAQDLVEVEAEGAVGDRGSEAGRLLGLELELEGGEDERGEEDGGGWDGEKQRRVREWVLHGRMRSVPASDVV